MLQRNDLYSVQDLAPARPVDRRYELPAPRRMVLLADGEKAVADAVRHRLERENLDVVVTTDGESALGFAIDHAPDLALINQDLAGIDGLELCGRLRAEVRTRRMPIVLTSRRTDEIDRIIGLESGADDYLARPLNLGELTARVRATLRRIDRQASVDALRLHGPLKVDLTRHEASVDDQRVDLTGTEFRILAFLSARSPAVVSRDQIIENAVGTDVSILGRAVDVHMSAIRRKLGPAQSQILTIRGVGYRLTDRPCPSACHDLASCA